MSARIVPLRPADGGKSPTGAIAQELRRRITSGEWPLGSRISDKQIASELDVSRTPVREALVMLQAEGLVVTRPQSGTFVVDLTVQTSVRFARRAPSLKPGPCGLRQPKARTTCFRASA